MNVNVPYMGRKQFWEEFFLQGSMDSQFLIMGGDINLMLSIRKV